MGALERVRKVLSPIDRHRLCAAIATLAGMYVANGYSRQNYRIIVDDAMISLVYARNLALGNGLVFNAGERVEGYTNFLWVLLIAPFYWVSRLTGVDYVHLVIALSILLSGVALLLVYLLSRAIWDRNIVATGAALGLCVVDNSYTTWAGLALESHLLAVCLLSALYFARSEARRRFLWVGIALACAQATRPDAAVFSACLLGSEAIDVIYRAKRDGWSTLLAHGAVLLETVGVWLGLYGLYFAWRYHYYGFFFPNTYYAKLAGPDFDGWRRGWEYTRGFFADRWWVYAAGAGAVFLARDRSVRCLLSYAILHTVYVTYVGGDFFPGHRFFVAQVPVFALLCGASIAAASSLLKGSKLPRRVLAGAAALVLVVLLNRLWWFGQERGAFFGVIKTWRLQAYSERAFYQWLKDHKGKGGTVATGLIGNTGYWSEARVIDVFGIIDPVTAHLSPRNFGKGMAGHEKRAERAYVLSKAPDIIIPGYYFPGHWEEGYYFDTDVLAGGPEGLWRRDYLAESGSMAREPLLSFDPGCEKAWKTEGSAFKSFPSKSAVGSQALVSGNRGPFANSFDTILGDAATGRLVSEPFKLLGEKFVFRVGGGRSPERLYVALIVGKAKVRSATGRDSEVLGRQTWDIAEFRHREGRLEIYDGETGPRGHILADEFSQWTSSTTKPVAVE
jgi:hypothetical protein